MPEIICYTSYVPEGTKQNITFFDLLLDENLANGTIVCPKEVYEKVGTLNTRLKAKQTYEFLLRAIREFPVWVVGDSPSVPDETAELVDIICPTVADSLWDEFCTDCYVAGKYSKELMENQLFNPVVQTLLGCIPSLSNPEDGTKWLEKMLSHAPDFYEIDDDTAPILVYRGDDTCYNQLNTFADELAKALKMNRQRVEIFDVGKEGVASLIRYKGRHFKAVLGVQTYLFSVKMQDKITNLHDLIVGPKFNMILDHPVLLKEHIQAGPKDYYLLIHDRNYLAFAKKYYKNVKDCFLFTPGGIIIECSDAPVEKKYVISFIGSYYNYRPIISNIKNYDKKTKRIAARFLMELRHNVALPSEAALKNVLDYYDISLSDEEFVNLLFELRYVFFGVMYYYREKVIRALLNSGLTLHVFGNTWDNWPTKNQSGLIKHPAVSGKKALEAMRNSKISLNIMAWHKDGFTERIANSMLSGSLVVSDTSTSLTELFEDKKDLLLFDLSNLNTLPDMLKELLSSDETLTKIAVSGYEKALQNHLWQNRANELLNIIDTLN
ncbi:MAG: glycosyltransferase family 1 protein [Lachnospiraceae bacterium]|nr:glycosyltransferase family 1 protein [Lachnospiraceae bacterium]